MNWIETQGFIKKNHWVKIRLNVTKATTERPVIMPWWKSAPKFAYTHTHTYTTCQLGWEYKNMKREIAIDSESERTKNWYVSIVWVQPPKKIRMPAFCPTHTHTHHLSAAHFANFSFYLPLFVCFSLVAWKRLVLSEWFVFSVIDII